VPALLQNAGSMMQVYFLLPGHESVDRIRDARDFSDHVDTGTFNRFAHLLFARGVYLSPLASLHSVLCTPTTAKQIDRVLTAVDSALEELQQ